MSVNSLSHRLHGRNTLLIVGLGLLSLGAILLGIRQLAGSGRSLSTPVHTSNVNHIRTTMVSDNRETATLAGGCFWCLEAVFKELRGVDTVVSGYAGGQRPNPSYEQVCTGVTGHAETVQITFDPKVICYRDLLHIFFSIHDPTTLNRQGADVGTQYRSAIFYHSPEQKTAAEEVMAEVAKEGIWSDPIVTEVTPFTEFYPAEEYHQNYFEQHPDQGYCRIVIAPKVAKFREKFMAKLRKD
jgi:peptide-methionine (S)-S-oxide reductase